MEEILYTCRFCKLDKPKRSMNCFLHITKICKWCREKQAYALGPNVQFARPQFVCPVVQSWDFKLKARAANKRDREKNRIRKNAHRKRFPDSRKGESQFRQRNVYHQKRIFSVYKEEIVNIYRNCPEGMQVDHIIPILNEFVCGLHVPSNLQYLSRHDNNSKHNNWDWTMENNSWRNK